MRQCVKQATASLRGRCVPHHYKGESNFSSHCFQSLTMVTGNLTGNCHADKLPSVVLIQRIHLKGRAA